MVPTQKKRTADRKQLIVFSKNKNSKHLNLIIAFLVLFFATGCGPSEEERKEANTVYSNTLSIIHLVSVQDSAYVKSVHFLLREIQSPDLKKNKKKVKSLNDSISKLDQRVTALQTIIDTAKSRLNNERSEHGSSKLLKAAAQMLEAYESVVSKTYPLLNQKLKKITFPIKDADYSGILKLSFKADSSLNAIINQFNVVRAAYYEEYSLQEFRDK